MKLRLIASGVFMGAVICAMLSFGQDRPTLPQAEERAFQLAEARQLAQAPIPGEAKDAKPMPKGHGRGLIVPKDIKVRHAKSWERHKHHLKALANVTATSFDCRTLGWVPDFDDQGQCGDCWVFSGADACASAFIKAGFGKLTISKQQLLDCQFQGACDGGWPEDVAKVAKSAGVYTDADYGKTYNANPGNCKSVDQSKILKIADYGFCSQGDGVANYQDFKNAMVKFGVISICYDASGTPNTGPNGGVWKGDGGSNVDHAIKAIAFDDSKAAKGAVLCWNQWYGDDRDYFWAEWGANELGTSAMWTTATSLPPVPPTPPTPPGPTPPGPTPPPTPGTGYTGSITTTYANGVIINIETGTAVAEKLQAELAAAGVSPNIIADVLQLITDLKNKAGWLTLIEDGIKIIGDFTTAKAAEDAKKPRSFNAPEKIGLPKEVRRIEPTMMTRS